MILINGLIWQEVVLVQEIMLLYQKILEKRYAPEGTFEVEASKFWNPLLWNLSKQDTIKYRNTMNLILV